MKIAYIISPFPKPSETFICREINGLLKSGIDLEIFSFRQPSSDEISVLDSTAKILMERTRYISSNDVQKKLFTCGLNLFSLLNDDLYSIYLILKDVNPFALLGRALFIAEYIRTNKIQHIHVHWPYASKLADIVHRLVGISYSVSIHAHEVAHQNNHFQVVFENLSFAAFCNQAAMDKLMAELSPQQRNKSHLIYHGVNLEQFTYVPISPLETGDCLHIVSAGRITPTKGFDRLIRACAKAKSSGIHLDLTILGQGQPEIERELLTLAENLNFSEDLRITGWIPFEQVVQYIQKSHIFALLANTNFHDGLPNVVLEAMAVGRPIIISPLPAAEEAVSNGVEGFILNSIEDYSGFVHALQSLISDPQKLNQLGQAARLQIEKRFDEKLHLKDLIKLFEKNIQRPSD